MTMLKIPRSIIACDGLAGKIQHCRPIAGAAAWWVAANIVLEFNRHIFCSPKSDDRVINVASVAAGT